MLERQWCGIQAVQDQGLGRSPHLHQEDWRQSHLLLQQEPARSLLMAVATWWKWRGLFLARAPVVVSSKNNFPGYKSLPVMDSDWCSGDSTKHRVYVPDAWTSESMAYLARTRWARVQTRQIRHRGTRTFSEGHTTSSSQRAHVFMVKAPLKGLHWKPISDEGDAELEDSCPVILVQSQCFWSCQC